MKTLNRILVIDVESTCWRGMPPQGERSEIIEIGACLIDAKQLVRVDKRSIIVKPQHSRVSEFCTELTSLTQRDVDDGVSIDEACETLISAFRSRDITWASFGDYDRRQFERQLGFDGVPFGSRHINVKTLAGMALGLQHEVGMSETLAMMNLPLEGRHHRGHDDAWNIARILIELIRKMRREGGVTGE